MTTTTHSELNTEAGGFILKTGRADCRAGFFPSRYQLALMQDNQENIIDLGFSGSRVLERLLREPGQLISREELLECGWPGRVVGQGSLNQQIHALRQLLGDDQQRGIIQTVPRRGYMFNPAYYAGLSVPPPPAATKAEQDDAAKSSKRQHNKPRWLRRWAAAAVMGLTGLFMSVAILGYGVASLSQIKLISTEVNGGKAYILYVNNSKVDQPQELVMRRNVEGLATLDYVK